MQRIGPRHAETTFDVLADLRGQSEIEASAARGRSIPGLQGEKHGTSGKRQREAGLNSQTRGGLQREYRHRDRVMDRLGHVEHVIAELLDSPGIIPDERQRHAVAHSGDQQQRDHPKR